MLIYFVIFVLVLIIGLNNSRKINFFDFSLFVLLAAISGFRYDVGTDFFGYIDYFERIQLGNFLEIEKGYYYINVLIEKLNLGYQAVFLIVSILTMTFFFLGLKYFSRYIFVSKPLIYLIFLIFTYFSSLNGMRQVLATSILFFAVKYIIKRDFLKFSVWIFIAMQFHFSSIVFFPLYFLAIIDYKKVYLYIGLMSSFFISGTNILNNLLEFIVINAPYLDFGGYISNYLFSDYNSREVRYGLVYFINILIIVVLIFFKDRFNKSSQTILLFNLFYLYVIISVLSMETPFLTRLMYLFSIYMALCIPVFVKIFDVKSAKIIEYFLISLYSLLYLYIIINGYLTAESVDYIPYKANFNIFP